MGSSVNDEDNETCLTCQSPVKTAGSGVGTEKSRWAIKVFASNGLMRASAWTAAWSEMESVDVEILPWISDEIRRKLDERKEEDAAEERERQEDEAERIKELVEEQVQLAYEQRREAEEIERRATTVREEPVGREMILRPQKSTPSLPSPTHGLFVPKPLHLRWHGRRTSS